MIDIKSARNAENWDRFQKIEDVMDQESFIHLRTHVWRSLREEKPDNTSLMRPTRRKEVCNTNNETGGSDMITKLIKTAIAAALLAGTAASSPPALAQTAIGVSYQPSLYWALPFYYATVKGWWKEVGLDAELLDLPGRRAADRGLRGEILGCRRHRLGAGGARRGALQHPDHRHHQRRIEGQRDDGARRQVRRHQGQSATAEGPEAAADHQLHRAIMPRANA